MKIFLLIVSLIFILLNLPGSWYIDVEEWEQGFKKDLFYFGLLILIGDLIWIYAAGGLF